MSYRVIEITEEHIWEKFLAELQPHSFLQSWKWGEQYRLSGSSIFRLGVFDDERLVAVALFIRIVARRGSFLLCPHGPIFASLDVRKETLSHIVTRAEELARDHGCDFLRFCPLDIQTDDNQATYQQLGFRDAPIHMHPELSWMLDLSPSEDELLKNMRKTTRYLIKKTEKEGVEVFTSTSADDIEIFWPVYQATVDRQGFTPFRKEYLRQEFALFSREDQAMFFFSRYHGEIIAATMIIFYNQQAFYHHSGSIQKFDKINASSLLQWRAIQEAKKRGCHLYNFWGIAPDDKPKHPWAGLSLFKKGFGGFAEHYVHAQDKPLTRKYWLNYVIETVRRLKRGY